MKKITFVTTNRGKIESLRRKLPEDIQIESVELELPELQVDSSSEVVSWKAKEAFKILKKPLLVQDSSFHIKALNGFPGSYIKYMLKTVKIEGILQIMRDEAVRDCYFEDSIGFTDNGQDVKVFVSRNNGSIAREIDSENKERAWSDLWKIFIPVGCERPLSSVSEEELEEAKKQFKPGPSCFAQFAEWFGENVIEE